jgi:hypothetical protein
LYFAKKNKQEKEVFKYLVGFGIVFFVAFLLIFGQNLFEQTFSYHLLSKTGDYSSQTIFGDFFTMNFPFIFLSMVIFYLTRKKEVLIPIFLDLATLGLFRVGFSHYFFLSIPLYIIFLTFYSEKKGISEQLIIFIILFTMINQQTIIYHNAPNPGLNSLISFMESKNGTIWGESITMNIVSFLNGNQIIDNEMDAETLRLILNPGISESVFSKDPDYLILTQYSSSEIFSKELLSYNLVFESNSTPNIFVFQKT